MFPFTLDAAAVAAEADAAALPLVGVLAADGFDKVLDIWKGGSPYLGT